MTQISATRQGARALQAAAAKPRCGAAGEAADEASKVPRNCLMVRTQRWLKNHLQ